MRIIIVIFSFIVALSSCDTPRYAYSPTAHNVPVFTKKGDTKLAANYSTNMASTSSNDVDNEYDRNIAHGFDFQGAIAVTKNFAVQANYYYRYESTNMSSGDFDNFAVSKVRYNRYFFDIGGGFFKPVDSKEKMIFQAYMGGGWGKTTIDDAGDDQNLLPYSRYYNADLTKFYFEPSFTFRPKEAFAATLATRVTLVNFRNINTNYSNAEKRQLDLDSLDRYAIGFFEPAFICSFGFNKLPGFRLELQTGLSLLWDQDFIDYRPFNFSVGLVFDIRKLAAGAKKE